MLNWKGFGRKQFRLNRDNFSLSAWRVCRHQIPPINVDHEIHVFENTALGLQNFRGSNGRGSSLERTLLRNLEVTGSNFGFETDYVD
jgi:uncharacterized protein YjbI with pentapeptide repeats